MPERSFQPHSIGGFSSTTPSYTHLRSISFDQSYLPPCTSKDLPPTPPELESAYGYGFPRQSSRRPVQEVYPIVSAWSLDEEDTSEEEVVGSPSSMGSTTPMMESILGKARANGKELKRKLSCLSLSPRKGGERERRVEEEEESEMQEVEVESGLYDPQPSSWSSSTDSNRSTYSQWEAIRLRVSIYLYWKRQALARKLSFRSS